jgi:hypothetical protein
MARLSIEQLFFTLYLNGNLNFDDGIFQTHSFLYNLRRPAHRININLALDMVMADETETSETALS